MQKKEFKAESKRLLEMMIHSIYTNNEIFLRELISNASDALDKLYFKSLTDDGVGIKKDDLQIKIDVNTKDRELIITDNGIGMTKEELENNLGTIAKSGSLAFKNENELNEDVSIIGQFGVGFYSAFMVAKKVTVISKAYGEEIAYKWESEGVDGYTIEECDKDTVGTIITLSIKDSTDDDNYDEYLQQFKVQSIIKKYSDYIHYPIKMEVSKSRLKDGSDSEYEDYTELDTINSMVPIWKKSSTDLTDEDYNNFYKDKFYDFEDPLKVIHSKTEGTATYNALMYIPARAPYNYYSKEFEKGLQLYSNGVLIMDKCSDLLPDYFSFVRGLVDSEDLSLNISREMLQQDKQLKLISTSIEKKIKTELTKMLNNDRDKYVKFFEAFGLQLKFGIYNSYGMNKDALKDLVMFYSSSEKKLVTLSEYVSRMAQEQKYIYYATGENVQRIDNLPQTEAVKDKGYEILYLTDDIDEFAIKMLLEYNEKQFKSVSAGDLELETEEEKKKAEQQIEESKDLLSAMKDILGDRVKEVKVSQRLKNHPVCLSSYGQVSIEMEKVLNTMPTDQKVKADKILEVNANHPIFTTLKNLLNTDGDMLKAYTEILYNQALLIEGISIEDPVAFSNSICEILSK